MTVALRSRCLRAAAALLCASALQAQDVAFEPQLFSADLTAAITNLLGRNDKSRNRFGGWGSFP